MIGRFVWILLLAGIAIVTAQLQLDRQALRDPELGEMVAEPFKGNAQFTTARAALAADDPAFALEQARKLVARRPVPAEHLTLLAQAYVKAGEIEPAAQAVQIAAGRGWRDPVAQEAMARLAINAGDLPEATRRFTALMVLGVQNDELLADLADTIFAEPQGPAYDTLVTMLSETERWKGTFLRRAPGVMPPAAYAQVIIASTQNAVRFDCRQLTLSRQIIERRDAEAGAAIEAVEPVHCRPS